MEQIIKRGILFEVVILISIIFITLFLHHFPTYYASTKIPPGYVFSGQAAWFDPWDTNVYVSAIKEGQSGSLLYNNKFTTTVHNSILVYPLYTWMGFMFRNTNPFIVFHLSSALFGSMLVIVVYLLSGVFVHTKAIRLLTTFLIVNGGGIGWLVYRLVQLPDVTVPFFTFYEGFQRAHVAFVLMLYIASFVFFYLGTKKQKTFFFVISGLSLSISLVFHPYTILSYAAVILAYSLYLKQKDNNINGLVASFFILLFVFFVELALMKHLLSSVGFGGLMGEKIPSPNPLLSLISYSVLLAASIPAIKLFFKNNAVSFLIIWFVVSLFITFVPVGFSVFYLRGLLFPLTILAMMGLLHIRDKSLRKYITLIIIIFAIGIGTKVFIFSKRVIEADKMNQWFYISSDINQALQFFENNGEESGILSGYYMGNLIPAYTNDRVFYGHTNVSPHASEHIVFLHYFYGNQLDDNDAKKYLKDNTIDYIVYGQEEAGLTKMYSKKDGLKYAFLKKVYTNETVDVYSY